MTPGIRRNSNTSHKARAAFDDHENPFFVALSRSVGAKGKTT
jgi:hypothetical protein